MLMSGIISEVQEDGCYYDGTKVEVYIGGHKVYTKQPLGGHSVEYKGGVLSFHVLPTSAIFNILKQKGYFHKIPITISFEEAVKHHLNGYKLIGNFNYVGVEFGLDIKEIPIFKVSFKEIEEK